MSQKPVVGSIGWHDLTVPDADGLKSFYQSVVGWTSSSVDVDDYQDYCVNDAEGQTVAGLCHARGVNADMPAQWLIYINVDNLTERLATCVELGGKVIQSPRTMGGGMGAVIQDPAGALIALYES